MLIGETCIPERGFTHEISYKNEPHAGVDWSAQRSVKKIRGRRRGDEVDIMADHVIRKADGRTRQPPHLVRPRPDG